MTKRAHARTSRPGRAHRPRAARADDGRVGPSDRGGRAPPAADCAWSPRTSVGPPSVVAPWCRPVACRLSSWLVGTGTRARCCQGPRRRTSPPHGVSSELGRLALAADDQPAPTVPGPGQYLYTSSEGRPPPSSVLLTGRARATRCSCPNSGRSGSAPTGPGRTGRDRSAFGHLPEPPGPGELGGGRESHACRSHRADRRLSAQAEVSVAKVPDRSDDAADPTPPPLGRHGSQLAAVSRVASAAQGRGLHAGG